WYYEEPVSGIVRTQTFPSRCVTVLSPTLLITSEGPMAFSAQGTALPRQGISGAELKYSFKYEISA
ncbi:MAG: hypothetical protein JW738_02760, partial [Actinobacteria bacterium]|nr:hypothetical protein [Actinomycetota bacterium]